MLNKIIRYIGYALVYIWTGIQLFGLALWCVSPVFALGVCIFDLFGKIAIAEIAGKLWIIWIGASAVVWLFLLTYTINRAKR